MTKNKLAQPFLKWAGGKRQLLPEIRKYIPKKINTYYEPFLGAGAVLFDIQPKKAVINDINTELINTYIAIRDHVDELINDLKKHKNEKEYFYAIRDLDRKEEFKKLSLVERASRIIYLNKTCFNGLFRVNSQGHFNVPFGKYKNPQIVNEIVLRAVHNYLNSNDITILNVDFEKAVENAKKGDFIYFDPPYDPVSDTSSFTGYSLYGFDKDDQIRLRDLFVELDKRGCKVLLSNSATDFIKDLYKDFHIEVVSANRNINANASRRGKIDEVLVMNYEPDR
ncbi:MULTISPECIES: DNA adenine methylase [Anoxybacillaceae]|uniref:Site-specific DNA-methyltransferase (adenine-specific) n=2 Tax=Anoxybacillaceae TaxID=3120669 RepID=A0A023DEZ4_9BACL|nr:MULTISPECIES: DNA adenine methylase [Bacillaceae]ABO67403.1 Putative adenine-specific DNA methyltransferase [Geobacillus thermodenitrificans NG80-2]MBB3853153.1 DNA adenine methylase [Parageobacillus caldoxylosilyticus]MED0661418.1 DNA methyltransferase [Geobacillus thermodenitrificans]BDG34257.1 modification methylase [Parageobacillus caldoxylosilyticus]BDG38025.1 modification methylase [Parageobacillus caldoxylosilyticus]